MCVCHVCSFAALGSGLANPGDGCLAATNALLSYLNVNTHAQYLVAYMIAFLAVLHVMTYAALVISGRKPKQSAWWTKMFQLNMSYSLGSQLYTHMLHANLNIACNAGTHSTKSWIMLHMRTIKKSGQPLYLTDIQSWMSTGSTCVLCQAVSFEQCVIRVVEPIQHCKLHWGGQLAFKKRHAGRL